MKIKRQNERLGFGYDAAHNLHTRQNGGLAQTFTTDAANQLNTVTRTGTFTMSGATPAPAASVTVNGQAAQIYGDFTFARTNLALADGNNTFTNIAQNTYGVKVTNTLTLNLPASVTLGFDLNGNLTNDGAKVFAFDAENQLTNVMVAGKFKKDFVYDGLNRLRIKREYTWTGSTWSQPNEAHLIWDGNVIIQHRNASNVPTLTLTRGLDLSGSLQGAGGVGGLLAMTDGGGTNYFYHNDGSGNVTALMDAQENIVARREYDAFGRTINLSGTKTGISPYWFSSQLYDADTDLYHYQYRLYSPRLQRWLTEDPLGEAMGLNLYEAFFNSPTRYVDRSGRDNWANMAAGNNAPVGINYTSPGNNSSTPAYSIPQLSPGNPNAVPYVKPQSDRFGRDALTLGNWNADQDSSALKDVAGFNGSLYGTLLPGAKAPVKCPAAKTAPSFFEGASYTPKVLKQMEGGVGEFHSFPESVTAFEGAGTVRPLTGGDGAVRQMLEIPGSYGSGGNGVFRFIKNADGTINERLFVPNSP